jgi:hypothetical protein
MFFRIATVWWAPILQTAIAAIAAIGGGACVTWTTWQKERQSLANALAGEIEGFIDVLNWRNARELLEKGYQFPIGEGAFPVFTTGVGKIGVCWFGHSSRWVMFGRSLLRTTNLPAMHRGVLNKRKLCLYLICIPL